jgi:hypothetical protein
MSGNSQAKTAPVIAAAVPDGRSLHRGACRTPRALKAELQSPAILPGMAKISQFERRLGYFVQTLRALPAIEQEKTSENSPLPKGHPDLLLTRHRSYAIKYNIVLNTYQGGKKCT